ncbi:hypothetical protein ALC60_12582 [Trachymyrmex zeteki]|uniref:EGF-like domain-containing protein n=1 Tax=Mycetomoellerius zeteki TaxID=64791 RepID=A0A151WK93_9HYME|nr:PREDICTED: uncharacterized protein LOC108729085 [Trachymyrmex zeteki]KYQ48254.1 hypothetical protein ALC60_12582 [Trachymyrmex zeteki]
MRSEMSLQIILSVLLIVSIFSPLMSAALTTFGKSNPQNQNSNPPPPPTPTGKARECKTETDCGAILNTTCIADSRGKTRCLCDDNSAPINGLCTNKFKALHRPCNSDSECIEDAHCVMHNSSMGKRCYCQKGFYQENPLFCNGCLSIFTLHTMILLAASLVLGSFNYI